MSKFRVKLRCKGDGCGKVIPLRDGGQLSSKTKLRCGHCGYENQLERKRNGKFRMY